MSFETGKNLHISIFGQSHSKAIGVVIDKLPAGIEIDMEQIKVFMNRRAPGQNSFSTPRKESDTPIILSGIVNGKTCGAPLCMQIENKDTRSSDYDKTRNIPRPMHADYPAYIKYKGFNDISGGGHFSGRLTAPLVFAGAVCIQILENQGITIGSHIASIGNINDTLFDPTTIAKEDLETVIKKPFPVLDNTAGEKMQKLITEVKEEKDSVGGVVECCVLGVPAGTGEPMFHGIENSIAKTVFGIPAVKGLEFGAGFSATKMKGSEHNDSYYYDSSGNVKTKTNNHGGILGGITTGMAIVFRVAFKPTPSIGKVQESIDLIKRENVQLEIEGRHDPCIVLRALPCVEAAAAIALCDLLLPRLNSSV